MAQYPRIKLEVLSTPAVGNAIRIYIGPLSIIMTATDNNPPGFGYYLRGATPAETTQNLHASLNAQYGLPFMFLLANDNTFVEIIYNDYAYRYFTFDIDNVSDFNVTLTAAIPPADFGITGLTYATASANQCDNVKVTALIDNGTAPYTIRAIYNGATQQTKVVTLESDLFFDFPRYTSGSRRIEIDSDGVTKSIDVPVIERLAFVTTTVAYTEFNATVTVIPLTSTGVSATPFQFSVDGINYQSSNVFDFGISGNYIAYVVDNFGCQKNVQFTVNIEERKEDPFFKIEITNPLRFVDQSYSGIKNITNQLSADYDISNVESRFYRQPFRIGDIIRTQYKSNYENHAVKLYNCDDVLIDTFTPVLKVENVNLLDKRDVQVIGADGGKANVVFIQGSIYDPVTDAVIDTYFQAGGRLPSFVRVGMLLTFNEPGRVGTFEVEEIVYNDILQAWACVIDVNWIGSDTLIALSTYNLEEYNIYETEIALPAGQYYAVLEATDASTLYPDQEWKSEPFWFSDDSEVVIIDYSSEINEALIDYRTNIEFRLCIPARFAKYQPDVQGEEFRDDLGNIYLQKSTYNRTWAIETDLLPWWLAEKVMIASRHRTLKINGIEVVNTEAPEITDRLGDRNPFYQITGIYQENIDISIADETGIISGARGILSGNESQVIGI